MRASGRNRLALLLIHTLLLHCSTFVLRPTATYRALELDVGAAWLGALGATYALAPLALAIPAGHLADRLGERRIMVSGAVVMLASALIFVGAADTVIGIAAASAVLGVGHLCCVIGQQSLVANTTERHRYDAAFGRYTFAASLGQSIGPLLILVFGGERAIPDTKAIFAWSVGLVLVLVAVTAVLPERSAEPGENSRVPGSVRSLLHQPGLLNALVVSSLVLAAIDITLVYLPALGAERGIAAGTVGVLLAVRAGASMAARLFLGRLSARVGRGRLLVASIALSTVCLAVLALPMPVWALGLMLLLAGAGLGAGQPLTMSWMAEVTPQGLRGRAMSLRLTGNRVGQVVVPAAAGAVAAGTGAGGVLLLTAAGLGVAAFAARRMNAG